MAEAVLDASALIAFLRKEKGADKVADILTRCCISSGNLAETYAKLIEYGKLLEEVVYQVERLHIPVIDFDPDLARIAASLWKPTRNAGLSLGDRACLALALKLSLPAFTAEDAWSKCPVGVKIVDIR